MVWFEMFEEGFFEMNRQKHLRIFRVFCVFRRHIVFLCNNHSVRYWVPIKHFFFPSEQRSGADISMEHYNQYVSRVLICQPEISPSDREKPPGVHMAR